MGKLNIAHHKSYHPYRRDNIERVRRDEEAERLKGELEEGRIRLADSEARISLLRERAGLANDSAKSRKKLEEKKERALLEQAVSNPSSAITSIEPSGSAASLKTDGKGHINLFEDLEAATVSAALVASSKLASSSKDSKAKEDEKGIPLAPSKKDLKPWYSEREMDPEKGRDEDRRNRDSSHKSLSDPLTSINRQLAVRFPSSSTIEPQRRDWGRPPPPPSSASNTAEANVDPARAARLSREASERERALSLIARRKREAAGSATPSTVSGSSRSRYGDQFNARDVEEAHRDRERQDRRERERRRHSERRWDDV